MRVQMMILPTFTMVSDDINDQESSIPLGSVVPLVDGVGPLVTNLATLASGTVVVKGGPHLNIEVPSFPKKDEVESPLPIPSYNVIDLDSEATIL